MTEQELNRRGFHQLTLAALGGVVAGSGLGCQPEAAPKGGGATAAKPTAGGDKVSLLMQEQHVCRGLNMCKGKGADKQNTCAGQGGCSLVAKHDCSTMNECKGQGGCGANPGENDCKGKGGCAVPLKDHAWDSARKNFEAAMKKAGREVGAAPAKS